MTVVETRALNLVNASRRVQNMRPVKYSRLLTRIARRHSSKLLQTHHDAELMYVRDLHFIAENAAGAPYDANLVSTMQRTIMQSKSHRENVLGDFRRCGIGIVTDGERVFETQVFSR